MTKKYNKTIRYVNTQGAKKIDWTDGTWNPMSGCTNRCWYCYNKRLWDMHNVTKPTFYPERLDTRFDKLKPGTKIFVGSAADVFCPGFTDEQIQLVIGVMGKHSHITFQLLTKFPQRYADFSFPLNCWLGMTITNSGDLYLIDGYQPHCKNINFISFEPLLGFVSPMDEFLRLKNTDWVIIGRLTGHTEPYEELGFYNWFREIISACGKLKIPVFIKDNVHKDKGEAIWHPKERSFEPIEYPHRQEFPELPASVYALLEKRKKEYKYVFPKLQFINKN